MTNNWKTPKSEKFLEWEALMEKQAEKLCAERPDLSDEAKAKMILAMPEIAKIGEETTEELRRSLIENVIDKTCFVYRAGTSKHVILDEELLQMSDRELAAWAQKAGVMFAQLKAHIVERFPKTEGKA